MLRVGAATISGGLMMTVEGPGGVGPGGMATKGQYKVTVQSPSWLSASSLEVIVDGITTETRPLVATAGPGPGKKYEATIDVSPTQSKPRHWVVFHAKSDAADLAPAAPGPEGLRRLEPDFLRSVTASAGRFLARHARAWEMS